MQEHDVQLIRRYCDGELDAAQRAALEVRMEADPDLAALADGERRLRRRIAAVMSASCAPSGLRERIESSFVAPVGAIAPSSRRPRPADRARWLLRRRQANFWAMAASLMLVTFVVVWGIYAPQIDQVGGGGPAITDITSEAAVYASREHSRCADSWTCADAKIIHRTREDAAFDLSRHLGVDRIIIFDLSEIGYEFLGEGHCSLPGRQPSAHLIYGRENEDGRASMVSLFVAPNHGQFGCRKSAKASPGQWRQAGGMPECQSKVLRTLDCSLVYFLVCCDGADIDPIADLIARALADAG